MAKAKFDPYVYEEERWTLKRPSQLFAGWTEKLVYSITNRGTYSRLYLYNKEGKETRYGWTNSGMTSEKLEAQGFTLTKRRKPKKVNIK